MKYYVQVIESMGRCVIAAQDLKPFEIVMTCEVLPLNQIDTKKVNETELRFYTFTFDADKKLDCLVLGDGEIFNHSDYSNVSYELQNLNSRWQMVFRTKRPCLKGEQLYINYNDDVQDKKEDVLATYTTNMM